MKTFTHPADGIYSLNLSRIEAARACWSHRRAWEQRNGSKDIPITLREMIKQQKGQLTSSALWCISQMNRNCHISNTVEMKFSRAIIKAGADNDYQRAKLLMDCLLIRAKREKRIR